MAKKYKKSDLQNFPACVAEFIRLVIKKMRYRKKVRRDVQAELAAHFEDELKDCTTDGEKDQKAQKLIAEFGDVKLLAVLLRRAKKRCRPLWRTIVARTFQTIGVLILCFIVYCIYISVGKPTISVNYIEEMIRIARPVADESLNAAPLYQRAIDAYKEPPDIEIEREVKGQEISRPGVEKVSLLVAIRQKDWIGDLTEEEISSLEQWISSNAEAIRFFKQASRKPHCWWQREAKDNVVFNVLMPALGSVRNIVRLLCWRAKLKAFNGDIEGAFENLLVCYRVGSHFKGPRVLVEQLVGIAIQALATKDTLIILNNREIDGRLLKSFQDELEQLMAEDTYIVSYQTERFFALDFIQRCYTNNGRGSGHMIPGQLKSLVSDFIGIGGIGAPDSVLNDSKYLAMAMVSANRDKMSRAFEKFYNTAQGWTTKTPWQLRGENVDFEMGLADWSLLKKARYWPIATFMPALGKVSELAYRNKVQVEAFIVIVAILRYKQERGNYPENLSELLEAGLLKELPMDPFSNKPVVYRKIDDGFMLYSVGLNFEDDGGQVVRDKRGRVKKWADEGDVVFWPVQKN